jgi:hypothetical protein
MVMVENITIMLNGKPVEISRILKDGTNYVGLRQVAELMGAIVGWEPDKALASIDTIEAAICKACEG